MRLIDADALIKGLKIWRDYDPYRKVRTPVERWIRRVGVNIMIKAVETTPAIEAEPVRHGTWEEYPNSAYRRCTNCKTEYEKAKFSVRARRCPNCGAIMDGGTE